ncbi:guanine nucleotide-binding protein-like 3-like protein isoform X4 [Calonectris borealis]|uniref:guanine nucleotide-binding protein-like 3-like protein isoform X4 n=1 Tax=Calonectris borealis TaxID=1323832 RepID=UPI003F4BEDF6
MTRSRRQVEAARRKRVQGKHAKAAGKKDPGVLQLSRFAAHVQQQNEKRQKRAAEAQRRREEARETEVGRRRSLAGLQQEALRRQREFERKEVAAAATQPDAQEEASLRQYGRELRKKQSRLPVATVPDDVLAGGACVGADCLLRVLANYSRSGEVKTTITVGVVGYPNVGKSSLINSLKRSRACGVGAAPGVTRCLQAVQLDRHIQLLDCPGVVMATGAPPAAAPLRGALAPQRLRDPLSPAAAILRRCPPEQLSELYGVPPCADPRQFLSHLARRQGRLRPGGLPDPRAAAVALLRDWTSGKISYYTRPPETQGVQLEAQILTALGPALDLEALERGDAEALAAIPATVTGIGLSPCVPEAEEEEEKSVGEEETAMEDDDGDLELGAVTVELKPRVKTGGGGEGSAPRAPRLEEVAALPPLLQGQGLRAAGKRRKKLQKRAEKIATKLSETLEAAMQL